MRVGSSADYDDDFDFEPPHRPLCAAAAWWFLYYAAIFAAGAGAGCLPAFGKEPVFAYDAETVEFERLVASFSSQVSQMSRVSRVAIMPSNHDLNSEEVAVAGIEANIAYLHNTLLTARRALKIAHETPNFAEGSVAILRANQGTAQEIVANLQRQVDVLEGTLQSMQAEIARLHVTTDGMYAISDPKNSGEHWGFHWALAVAALRFFVVRFALRTLG